MGNALSSVTASVSVVGENVAAKFAEKQKEMMATQREAQMQMAQNQMKRMQATMMAQTRELLVWEAGVYAFIATAATLRTIATRHFYPPIAVPLLLMPYVMAYQIDLAYGNKFDRVKAEADRILVEEAHWFTDVPKEQSKKKVMTNGLL